MTQVNGSSPQPSRQTLAVRRSPQTARLPRTARERWASLRPAHPADCTGLCCDRRSGNLRRPCLRIASGPVSAGMDRIDPRRGARRHGLHEAHPPTRNRRQIMKWADLHQGQWIHGKRIGSVDNLGGMHGLPEQAVLAQLLNKAQNLNLKPVYTGMSFTWCRAVVTHQQVSCQNESSQTDTDSKSPEICHEDRVFPVSPGDGHLRSARTSRPARAVAPPSGPGPRAGARRSSWFRTRATTARRTTPSSSSARPAPRISGTDAAAGETR